MFFFAPDPRIHTWRWRSANAACGDAAVGCGEDSDASTGGEDPEKGCLGV